MDQTVTMDKPSGLFSRIKSATDDRLPLQEAAQLAVQVEWTTIPAYLTALYSIKQVDSQAYQLLRSVVMEEMYHVNQAANILVSIGGLPRFTNKPGLPAVVPAYPCYLPHANQNTTPFVGLFRASPDVFENVFAAIETPAPYNAQAEGDNYSTIAQLYAALVQGLGNYSGSTPLFTPNKDGRQRTDMYLGKFGGVPVEVTDADSALHAVTEITQQGEGTVPLARPLIDRERWGTYNHYGARTDGTYGPIIGTPYEMSHFSKFRTVALDKANFPETYPIISNARREDFPDPKTSAILPTAVTFDIAYSIMLDTLEASFRKQPEGGAAAPFFSTSLPLMHQVMPVLARILMTTPLSSDGDSSVGPNAAPTFIYQPNQTLKNLADNLAMLVKNSSGPTQNALQRALECVQAM